MGLFSGTIIEDLENKALVINGQIVHMIQASSPDKVDYKSFGIDNALVIDNTGVFRDREALGLHLKSEGAGRVLLTAPGNEVPNVVYGINHKALDVKNEKIYSAAVLYHQCHISGTKSHQRSPRNQKRPM